MATTWHKATTGASANESTDRDDSLLEDAVEAYWARVCRTLYRLVGDWDEAEDLALEVFYRLHDSPPREADKVSSWLYRVATNVGLNAIRGRKRRRRYEEAAGALKMQRDAPPDPAVEVERHLTQLRVRHVLAAMKPRSAQLLILRYSGFSYAELADILNVAPGSIGKMLARAERAFEQRYRALEERDATHI